VEKIKNIIKWILVLWCMGEIIFSYQFVGIYYLVTIFEISNNIIWLLVFLINGLRFTLQSIIFLGVLQLVFKKLPPLKYYVMSSILLALAGVSSAILRLTLSPEIGVRYILEQIFLIVGFVYFSMRLANYYSIDFLNIKDKILVYFVVLTLATIVFWIMIPIPL